MQTIWIDKEFGKYWSLQKHLKLSERINELKKKKKKKKKKKIAEIGLCLSRYQRSY